MANDLNLCQFIGRLGKDPEKRYTSGGDAVANLSIACGWKTKSGDGVEWVSVVAFGKLAEIIAEYLRKGSQVYLSGRYRTRRWQDQNGQDRYTTEIIANEMQMLGGRAGAGGGGAGYGSQDLAEGNSAPAPQNSNSAPSQPDQAPAGGGNFDDFDDDIPF